MWTKVFSHLELSVQQSIWNIVRIFCNVMLHLACQLNDPITSVNNETSGINYFDSLLGFYV